MALHGHHHNKGVCSPKVFRLVLFLMSVVLVGYIVSPPLVWHIIGNVGGKASCPPCICDCSSSDISLSLPLGMTFSSSRTSMVYDLLYTQSLMSSLVHFSAELTNNSLAGWLIYFVLSFELIYRWGGFSSFNFHIHSSILLCRLWQRWSRHEGGIAKGHNRST